MSAGSDRRRSRRLLGAGLLLAMAIALTAARFDLPAVAGSTSATIRLKERNDSGVSGRAKLEAANGAVWVRISVKGPDQDYLPYLRSGTCTNYRQAPAIPLSLVAPNAPSETAIDIPLAELEAGDYVIDIHAAVADVETLFDPAASVACGVVGKKAAPAGGTTEEMHPPVTGVGPIDADRDWLMAAAVALGIASFVLAVAGMREQRREAQGFTTIDVVRIRRLQGLPR